MCISLVVCGCPKLYSLKSSIEQINKSEWALLSSHSHDQCAYDISILAWICKILISNARSHKHTHSIYLYRLRSTLLFYYLHLLWFCSVLHFIFIHFSDIESTDTKFNSFIHDTHDHKSLRLPICPRKNLQRNPLLIKVCPSVNLASTIKSWWRLRDVQASLVTTKLKHRHVRANRWWSLTIVSSINAWNWVNSKRNIPSVSFRPMVNLNWCAIAPPRIYRCHSVLYRWYAKLAAPKWKLRSVDCWIFSLWVANENCNWNVGRFEIKLQAIATRTKNRSENSDATQYIRCAVDLFERKGQI